ncbi:MAG TPA: response regulator transcription factor [Sedimentisphaerales bacterium]|nr:response regulator transcription factor [Sedimentisphaerales bacterium]
MSIRILLVDDHGVIREGLRSLLEKQPDIEVVGEAEDGRKAVELVRELLPEIVIMDITMPNLNGVDATRQIKGSFPQVSIIALSIHANRRFVANMLKAGASAYILKECLFDELIQSIRDVQAGNVYLSPRITGVVVGDYIERLATIMEPQSSGLTDRQRQIVQALAEGKMMKQIALEFHVSVKTIEADRRQIMEKLNINSIAELTKYAVREGLTSLEA